MWNSILFNEEQLHWVEDLPECYINIISLPEGEIFDSDAPWEPICVREIPSFLAANEQMNIWRSWDVFKGWKDNLQCIGPMPIVIDIDDEKENLQSAHRLSVACLTYLQQEKLIQQESIRIVFSGKKGFHIEIKPDIPVDAQVFCTELIQGAARILDSKENLDGWNMFFESTTLDRFHDFIRLTGSVNSWRTSGGELLRRRMTQLGVKEFPQLSIRWLLEQTTLPSLRLGN